MPETPHFAFPFDRDPRTGKVRVVEQGSPEHVLGNDNVIVRCPMGWREERPEFGWPWPEFANAPLDLEGLAAALDEFGQPAHRNIADYAASADQAVRQVQIDVEAG